MNKALSDLAQVESSMVSVERCLYFTNTINELSTLQQPASNQELKQCFNQGKVQFINVKMRYRPQTPIVLQNVSFLIQPNQKVGIIGRTGSGKSSIFQALFRIVELEEGQILIDGVNIQTIPLETLRQKISLIPQEPILFSGTLRENLDFQNAYDDQEIYQVLKEIQLIHRFQENHKVESQLLNISEDESLNGGQEGQANQDILGKQISEQGQNISIGERQLICIGRAILRQDLIGRNNKILVMDEATAAIDIKTDEIIQSLIKEKFQDKTVITIAHRMHTIMKYDKVLYLKEGKIALFGDAQEIIRIQKEELIG